MAPVLPVERVCGPGSGSGSMPPCAPRAPGCGIRGAGRSLRQSAWSPHATPSAGLPVRGSARSFAPLPARRAPGARVSGFAPHRPTCRSPRASKARPGREIALRYGEDAAAAGRQRLCPGGETGRRNGLKIRWSGRTVRVRTPPRAPVPCVPGPPPRGSLPSPDAAPARCLTHARRMRSQASGDDGKPARPHTIPRPWMPDPGESLDGARPGGGTDSSASEIPPFSRRPQPRPSLPAPRVRSGSPRPNAAARAGGLRRGTRCSNCVIRIRAHADAGELRRRGHAPA